MKDAKKVITVLTCNDSTNDFKILFDIFHDVKSCNSDIEFNFSKCNFLRPNAVAFLGGVARFLEKSNRTVTFDWQSIKNDYVQEILGQNGFAEVFGCDSSKKGEHTIPYREDRFLDMNPIMDYLTFNWIGNGWVNVSDPLRDAIVGRMWEIYNNAFEHSNTPIGVFTCGQHFFKPERLILSTIDFGQGIPKKVRDYFLSHNAPADKVALLSDITCLKWAFTRGHSTCDHEVARGLGLDLLKAFVEINQGKLEIYSNRGYVIVDKDGERYTTLDTSFEGTIVHITLCCDENIYSLAEE